MVLKRKSIPDNGDIVVATVDKVFSYGAYVKLDEYQGYPAFLPWSEITTKHFRDIHEVVREGQRIVAKVIRIDRKKKPPAIDVSTKRVTVEDQRAKMIEWKRAQKAHNILEIVAKRLGRSVREIYEAVGWKLEDYFGEIMAGLEEIAMRGPETVAKLGIDDQVLKILTEEVKRHVEIKKVSISGVMTLHTLAPDGINRIRKLLEEIKEHLKGVDGVTSVDVYYIGSPRYRIDVEGYEYKVLEKALSSVIERASSEAKGMDIEFSFERIRE